MSLPSARGSVPPPADAPPAELVARLRAAGCVFAEDEARLLTEAAEGAELDAMVARRVSGEPLELVLGWVEFGGLRLAVAPGVFVPRRRSELVAETAIELLEGAAPRDRPAVVVELCCGVGAIAAATAAARPDTRVWAADLDAAAVACARANLPGAEVSIGDIDSSLPTTLRGRVDVLAANAPYVPTDQIATMPREAREHEPLPTLDGGPDGLQVVRRVVEAAPQWLAPGGHLIIETSAGQAPVLVELVEAAGLRAEPRTDPERAATVVIGAVEPTAGVGL
ncbi:MAG: putative protein N(5)-glutamine methyltransferase [Nocardioides sp.]|uniref:putative protein N(5)-glutamine methyltransferase n=1 Tax=Nocardioides sp. TaxID=35761 RepID=UPI0039E607A4